MIFAWRSRSRYWTVLIACILLAGCAARLPSSLPLAEGSRQDILARYQTFRQRDCSAPIDADILLEMDTFGKHLKASGMLQVQPPSSLRTTILDQLGRPLFILIAAGESLTLVNSMKGEALVGTVASITRENSDYLDLGTEEVIRLLTGRYAPSPYSIVDVRRDKQSGICAWLIFPAPDENRHNILFDPVAERILRHAISDKSGDVLLDIRYSWNNEESSDCSLPAALVMSGTVLGGEVTLRYEQLLLQSVLPEETFHLTLPEHYNIRIVE